MSSQGARKRARVEIDGEGGAPVALITNVVQETEWKKDKTFWFEDGNVIISVDTTLYKVYRGILADASPVFGDLFTLPQPPDGEKFDECPVVRLEDAVEDMTRFLKVLYRGLS